MCIISVIGLLAYELLFSYNPEIRPLALSPLFQT